MIITRKSIPRRTVLRGMGATLALPLLDGMVPALTAMRNTAAKPIRRLGVVYVPNGIIAGKWTPTASGAAFELTPILEPLAPFRDRLLVLSGLDDSMAQTGGGPHARAASTFLTGVHLRKTEGADIQAGISMDQIAARELGQHTQLASLELGVDRSDVLGACDAGYSCAYLNTIAWRTPTTPLPMEHDPRTVFERMFGGGSTDPQARLARIRQDRSILDEVTQDVSHLQRSLGPRDRSKLGDYLEGVRDLERRIQKVEEQSTRDLPVLEQPVGTPGTFEEHAKLMLDLQVLAYQCDMTRVITFMMSRESVERPYPEIGIREGHHSLTHHGGDATKIEKVVKINTYHVAMLAYYLEKLRSTPDGEGSLLDHVMLVYGAGLSDGNGHNVLNLPVLLVGGQAAEIKGDRHLRFASGTPLTNLHVTLLDKLGVPVERLGDSTGELREISDLSSSV